MKKSFIFVIALLLIFGVSSAVMAQSENSWEIDFQKEFGELDYLNQESWGQS